MALLKIIYDLSKIRFCLRKHKWQNCLGKKELQLQNIFKMCFRKTNWFMKQLVGNSDKFELKVTELLKEKLIISTIAKIAQVQIEGGRNTSLVNTCKFAS